MNKLKKKKKFKILSVGLNPALQKILTFKNFEKDEVNRAFSIEYIHGGKAANFTKASIHYGDQAVVYQFVGGNNGKHYSSILAEENIVYKNIWTEAETRVCSTCISDYDSTVTEIIEPSGKVSKDELDSIVNLIQQDLPDYDALALCGTFPPGVDGSFYANLVKNALNFNIPVLMDAHINIQESLKLGPHFLKINVSEFINLTGENNVDIGAQKIFNLYSDIKSIALTNGPDEAYLFLNLTKCLNKSSIQKITYLIPEIPELVNPIGAGDTVSAVFLSELLRNTSAEDAFHKALAAGAASCMTKNNADFSLDVMNLLVNKIKKIF
jgi:fructose-1-phosphate kinase PfkB-like protein